MDQTEKIRMLKSMAILEHVPEAQLAEVADFLRPLMLKDGDVVFVEGTKGESLYLIADGFVRISKRLSESVSKDLAILGPGDCFGEMALLEDVVRSASATVVIPTILFQLRREDLNAWLKSKPALVSELLTQLVQVQSRRLRRTSNELAMLYDLSELLLNPPVSSQELLRKALERVMRYLEGTWSAAAYLRSENAEGLDIVASWGQAQSRAFALRLPVPASPDNMWVDRYTYHAFLPEDKRPICQLIFNVHAGLPAFDYDEMDRSLSTAARLIGYALEHKALKS